MQNLPIKQCWTLLSGMAVIVAGVSFFVPASSHAQVENATDASFAGSAASAEAGGLPPIQLLGIEAQPAPNDLPVAPITSPPNLETAAPIPEAAPSIVAAPAEQPAVVAPPVAENVAPVAEQPASAAPALLAAPSTEMPPEAAVIAPQAAPAAPSMAPEPGAAPTFTPSPPVAEAPPPAAVAAAPAPTPAEAAPVAMTAPTSHEINAAIAAPQNPNAPIAMMESEWEDGGFVRSLQEGGSMVMLPGIQGLAADTYEPLSLDQAVALALHNNDAGKAAKATTKAAYWEKLASYSLYGPTVEVRLAGGNELSKPAAYNDASGGRAMRDSHNRNDRLYSIRQPIIDATVVEDILLKREREQYAGNTQRDTMEGLAYDTVTAYYNLMQASMAVKLAEDYREYLTRLAGRMQARVEGGGGTAGDIERIQGRMTNAESARIQAEGEYQNSLADFKRLTHVVPSRLAIPNTLAPAIPANVSEAITQAQVYNPAYLGMLDKVDMARKARDRSYAGLLPTVNFEFEHNYSKNAGGAANGNPLDGVYPTQDDRRAMLVAHWMITGGYDALNGVAGGQHVQEANFQAMDAKSRLEQAVQSAYNAVASANARIEALKKGVDANTNVVAAFEDQQQNGRRSLFELLDAYEQLYNSRTNLMRLVVARAQAGYLVHRQMGTLLPVLQEASEKANVTKVGG